jgi:hypothetical protein
MLSKEGKASFAAVSIALILLSFVLEATSPAIADAGVFTGNGQSLHQITSKTVQLVSINVTIILGRGPFLFEGTVPGMDRAEYECTFILQNLSDNQEEIQVGFPVDSQFATTNQPVSSQESTNWILDYGFIARDEKTTYHVEFVRRKAQKGPGEFGSVFIWNMRFDPKEKKTLSVWYRIPMSMGLVDTLKDSSTAGIGTGALSQELLEIAQLEMAGYVTSTGSSWAGNVESGTFTLITEPFERYLSRRGMTEEGLTDMSAEQASQFDSSFPVRHPWWFREIKPDGWLAVKGGVQWHHTDFKPKDPIEVRYYMTQFPRLPEEVDAFVDRFLKGMDPHESAATELGQLKQIVLATYGKEPEDDAVKVFASQQLWYAPRNNFSMESLDETEKTVLKKIDARIGVAKSPK